MSKNINDTELLEHLVESKINFIKVTVFLVLLTNFVQLKHSFAKKD